MKIYTLSHIINYARKNSKFYNKLYSHLPNKITDVAELPLLEQDKFWEANTAGEANKVLTGPIENGIVFKSGGTTGTPKFSVFTHEEFSSMSELAGLATMYNGLQTGDKVANLFYGGHLYASFIYTHEIIRMCPIDAVEYPIMGNLPIHEIVANLVQFRTNVLQGVPTTIIGIFQYAKENGIDLSFVNRIFFGGETFFEDQRAFVEALVPGVEIRSSCYALVDGGIAGFCDDSCGFNEHKVYDHAVILEIIDEQTGETITETNRKGKLVITCLYRILQPMLRYPLGDCGVWVDQPGGKNRKFKLLGRSEEGARVGPVSIYYDDFRSVFLAVKGVSVLNYQLIISHFEGKDKLTVLAAVSDVKKAKDNNKLYVAALYQEKAMFEEETQNNHIHKTEFQFCTMESLEFNERTGKVKRLIDNRL